MIEYKTIDRFPGYRFGSDGSVWTQWQNVSSWDIGRRGFRRSIGSEWMKMRLSLNSTARLNVSIKNKTQSVHRLIAEAFHGPCPPGLECCHNNGKRTDNRPENLRWDTRSANHLDKRRHGTSAPCNRKFTLEIAEDIRCQYERGEATQMQLAEKYETTQGTIWGIVRGLTYANI